MSLSILFMLAASPVSFTVQQQGWDAASNTAYLQVTGGDLDGDGVPDASLIKLVCAADGSAQAYLQPRESATGMATGKRNYAPVKIIKEWRVASPQMRESRPTYDVKTIKTARTTAVDDWIQVDVAGLPAVCKGATKTRSNIQNN